MSQFSFEDRNFYDNLNLIEEREKAEESLNSDGSSSSGGAEEERIDEPDSQKILSKQNVNSSKRSTRDRNKPKYLEDYTVLALSAEAFVEDLPEHFDDIQGRDDEDEWPHAVNEEMTSLIENRTWDLVPLPSGRKAIDNRWVFRIKRDQDGNIEKYKARLVIKGCSQRRGLDYQETYAPVARSTTVRTLLSIVNQFKLKTRQLDVKNAFLHGTINEEIFMKQPQELSKNNNLVCKLNRSLYGLKQAPRAWNAKFNESILRLGLHRSERDNCLYLKISENDCLYLLLYVDDTIIAGNNEKWIQKIVDSLKKEFSMKDVGELKSFLGIKIEQTAKGMFLSQKTYMINMLSRFGMMDCNPVRTPMEMHPEKHEDIEGKMATELKPYRELVGCLMYLMLNTRPDLSVAVNYYSRFQSDPKLEHWKGLKRILRYIKGTINYGLFFKHNSNLEMPLQTYVDANWATNNDRKSTTGFLLQVFGCTVNWSTKKQSGITLSSTETEYVALATALTEVIWLKGLLEDFNIHNVCPIVYEDNQSVIHLLSRYEHCRLKHVDVKYNFVCNMFQNKEIDVRYINTKEQIADMLTKSLVGEQFAKLCSYIGVCKN